LEVQPVFELDSSDAHGLGLRLFEVDDLQRFDASVADPQILGGLAARF
jgi:hypothetical protein